MVTVVKMCELILWVYLLISFYNSVEEDILQVCSLLSLEMKRMMWGFKMSENCDVLHLVSEKQENVWHVTLVINGVDVSAH